MTLPRFQTSAALIVGGVVLALTGCTGAVDVARQSPAPVGTGADTTTTATTNGSVLADPLTELTDPASDGFIGANLIPILHARGEGPSTFTVDTTDPAVGQIRYFVSCEPDASFTVTMGEWFSSGCSTDLGNSGEIPIAERMTSTRVSVDVPEGIDFWIVGIPVEAEPAEF